MSRTIRKFDNAHRFFVPSDSRDDLEHLVDLEEISCSCEHYVNTSKICKHIKQAARFKMSQPKQPK